MAINLITIVSTTLDSVYISQKAIAIMIVTCLGTERAGISTSTNNGSLSIMWPDYYTIGVHLTLVLRNVHSEQAGGVASLASSDSRTESKG